MPERIEKLRATLDELSAELRSQENLTTESRAQLELMAQSVAAQIRSKTATASDSFSDLPLEPPHTVREQLIDGVESFRVQHPTVAGILQRLVDGLALIGI